MRVALRVGGITTWIAGQPLVSERDFSSVSDFRVTAGINVQTDARVRATSVRTQDRKNLATTLTFGTTRKFASAVEAALWSLDYDNTMPRTGTLILETPLSGGGVSRRYMEAAVIRPPQRVVTGVTVELSYAVEGGLIKPTPPAGELP